MRQSYHPDIPPKPQPYRTQALDHLGLVAGMFEELGITEVIDQATQLYLVPHFFQNKPLSRLIAPGIQASHLN
jgi:hypothetical protein